MNIDEEEIAEAKWFPIKDTENIPAYPATKAFLGILRKETKR